MKSNSKDGSSAFTPFEAMTELCIEAAQLVEHHGTPRLARLLRPFLFELAAETVRRMKAPPTPPE